MLATFGAGEAPDARQNKREEKREEKRQ